MTKPVEVAYMVQENGHPADATLLATLLSCNESRAQKIIDYTEAYGENELIVSGIQQATGVSEVQASKAVVFFELIRRAKAKSAAVTQKTVLDDPAIAASVLADKLFWQPTERFAVVFLNVKHEVIGHKIVSFGTKTECLADPKEIFGAALKAGASRIIVAHNHPSGSLGASQADIDITRTLISGGQLLGLIVLDHIIMGNGDYKSLRSSTNLWSE